MSLLGKTPEETLKTTSGFTFSAAKADALEASEYTLVDIILDVSGSVSSYKNELEKAYKTIIGACRQNPRADFVLVRCVLFNGSLTEEHGYMPLMNIDESTFTVRPYGNTALWDAVLTCIEGSVKYGGTLTSKGFLVNSVGFVITDGAENSSVIANPAKIAAAIAASRTSEVLESTKYILISLGSSVDHDAFVKQAGLDQHVKMNDVDAKALAKVADFVSRSISSSSQSLGKGTPSQNLTI